MEGWYLLLMSYKTVLLLVIMSVETINIRLKEHSKNKTRIFQKQGAGHDVIPKMKKPCHSKLLQKPEASLNWKLLKTTQNK